MPERLPFDRKVRRWDVADAVLEVGKPAIEAVHITALRSEHLVDRQAGGEALKGYQQQEAQNTKSTNPTELLLAGLKPGIGGGLVGRQLQER